jgi:hypothetical protein
MTNAIDTDRMRALAPKFDRDVGNHLDNATNKLKGVQALEYSNFTSVAITLSVVYVEAQNFMTSELLNKRSTASDFTDQLNKTAGDWDKAEHASTVKDGH